MKDMMKRDNEKRKEWKGEKEKEKKKTFLSPEGEQETPFSSFYQPLPPQWHQVHLKNVEKHHPQMGNEEVGSGRTKRRPGKKKKKREMPWGVNSLQLRDSYPLRLLSFPFFFFFLVKAPSL